MDILTLKKAEKHSNRTATTRTQKHTHKVLICGVSADLYVWDARNQLFSAGFIVEMTGLASFAKNVDRFAEEFDIFIFASETRTLNYLTDVTPADVIQALQKWRSLGKKIVYYTSTFEYNIQKINADGTTDEAPLSDVIQCSFYAHLVNEGANPRYERDPAYPFGDDEVLTDSNLTPRDYVYVPFNVESGSVAVTLAVDDTAGVNIVRYKPEDWCIVSFGGFVSGDPNATSGYRYVDAGVICKHLLGLTSKSPQIALDCKESRKVAASSIDCDVTNEKEMINHYVNAYQGRPVELGVVVHKMNEDLANFYRNLGVEVISHAYWHHMAGSVKTATQISTIPDSLVIPIEKPYRLTLQSVKFVDDNTSLTSGSGVLGTGRFEYRDTGFIRFSPSDIGREVEITYEHSEEPMEWIGGVLELDKLKSITNKSVCLTGGPLSMHPASMLWLLRWGYTVCDWEPFDKRASYFFRGKQYIDKMIPWLSTFFDLDSLFYHSENEARNNLLPARVERCKRLNHPFLWYSHDFLFSKDYWVRIFENPDGRFHPDWWEGKTYEEVVAKAGTMISDVLDALDEENVLWMNRSDYSRWYNDISAGIRYSVEKETPDLTELLIVNEGEKTLKGLTVRMYSESQPQQIRLMPEKEIPFDYKNNETLFNVDIKPGEILVVTIHK